MVIPALTTEQPPASLFDNNIGLVVKLARTFGPKDQSEFEEFVQLGRIGLWKAWKKHDPTRSSFVTTAWNFIRYEIRRELHQRKKKKLSQMNENLDCEISSVSHSLSEELWEYMPDSLTSNEKTVLSLHSEGYTFIAIGLEMGFSKGWANQTYQSALTKIKNANTQ